MHVADALKKVDAITPPAWNGYVKTGVHKERPPADKDWWYMRSASVLRTVSQKGPIGVAKLRVKYGGRKRRGHKPAHFFRGSGNIIRKVLQQLEKAEFIKQDEKSGYKGRVITPKGRSLLDKIATSVQKSQPKPAPVKKEEKKVEAPKEPKVAVKKEEKKATAENKEEAKKTQTPQAPKETVKQEEKKTEAPQQAKPEAPKESKPVVKEAMPKEQAKPQDG